MRSALAMGAICATFSMASGCHKAFRTSIENATNREIYIEVPAHGSLQPGGVLNLYEEATAIDHIEYRLDGHQCRLDRTEIVKVARPTLNGKMNIALQGCNRD